MSNITAKQLKDVLIQHYDHNIDLNAKGFLPNTIRVLGESGIGKTSAVIQAAEELCVKYNTENIRWKKINLSNISDVAELVGFPKTKTLIKKDRKEKWVWDQNIAQYKDWEITDNTVTSYAHPEWVEYLSGGGILVLDDYSRSAPRILQAIMDILDRREYISWKLPANVLIVLTGNPSNGNYLVSAEDSAQTTRYITYNMVYDFESWKEWAVKNAIKYDYIDFIKINDKELFDGSEVNIRQWTKIFTLGSIKELEESFFKSLVIATVGEQKAPVLFEYLLEINRIEITGEEIFNTKYEKIEKKIKDLIYKENYYRNSVSAIIVSRIVNHLATLTDDNIIDKAADVIKRLALNSIINVESLRSILEQSVNKALYFNLFKDDSIMDLLNDADVSTT